MFCFPLFSPPSTFLFARRSVLKFFKVVCYNSTNGGGGGQRGQSSLLDQHRFARHDARRGRARLPGDCTERASTALSRAPRVFGRSPFGSGRAELAQRALRAACHRARPIIGREAARRAGPAERAARSSLGPQLVARTLARAAVPVGFVRVLRALVADARLRSVLLGIHC
jgi:hypothetical protein